MISDLSVVYQFILTYRSLDEQDICDKPVEILFTVSCLLQLCLNIDKIVIEDE